MDQALYILPVVNGADAGNKTQQKRQSRRCSRIDHGRTRWRGRGVGSVDGAIRRGRRRTGDGAAAGGARGHAANAHRSTRSHRLRGGTLRRAASRIRGNTRWPALLDDSRSSLLIPSFARSRLAASSERSGGGAGIRIGPFLETRLDLDHQPQIVVIFHAPVLNPMRAVIDGLPDLSPGPGPPDATAAVRYARSARAWRTRGSSWPCPSHSAAAARSGRIRRTAA